MVHEKVIKGFERWKLCTHKRFQLNTKRTNFAHRILHVIEINLYPTAFKLFLVFPVRSFSHDSPLNRWACLTTRLAIHVYDSLLLFYAITNRRNYMQSILFHCYVHSTCFGCHIHPSSGVQFCTRPHWEQVALTTQWFVPVAVNTVEKLYSWWWVYMAPETCRVNVAVKWNWLHIAASVGYFIEYIMMHGTINIKYSYKFAANKWEIFQFKKWFSRSV